MSKIIIGVMGPSSASAQVLQDAYELGRLIAREGWVLLSGGRSAGVMEAVNKGAKEAGGLTVGVLPSGDTRGLCPDVDIPLLTDMGNARNNINVLSSRVVIVCGMSKGTASEAALALKSGRPVIFIDNPEYSVEFFLNLSRVHVHAARTPSDAIALIHKLLGSPEGMV